MTKSPRKNVPDVGIELGAACIPSELVSDRATAPGRIFLQCKIASLILSDLVLFIDIFFLVVHERFHCPPEVFMLKVFDHSLQFQIPVSL